MKSVVKASSENEANAMGLGKVIEEALVQIGEPVTQQALQLEDAAEVESVKV